MAHILIVEDDQTVAALLGEYLRLRGHAVQQAGNGVEALQRVEQDDFDMILLDIAMPVMDGIVTLRHLRKRLPGLTIVMISGIPDERVALQAMDLGAIEFIPKPFDMSYLDRVVSRGLALSDMEEADVPA